MEFDIAAKLKIIKGDMSEKRDKKRLKAINFGLRTADQF